jgi:signal transduction histidine kinase
VRGERLIVEVAAHFEMKSNVLKLVRLPRKWAAGLIGLVWFFAAGSKVPAELLVAERFNQNVEDFGPIGGTPGWHAYGLRDGIVTDFTFSTPGDNFPCLSHSATAGGVGGVGYLVLGSGRMVSNVLAWMDCRLDLQDRDPANISFYSKNDQASSMERVVVRIGSQWFATSAVFHDEGGNAEWKLNGIQFNSAAGDWQVLDTNTLTLGTPLTGPLPPGEITGIGVFGQSPSAGKIRIDEFQVLRGSVTMDPTYLVGSWIWGERTQDRQTCRFWTAIEIPRGVSVSKARLRLTADNSYNVFLDGTKIGQGSEWRRLTEYDLTLLLSGGTHVLAVEAFNEVGAAGMVAGVTVDLDNGRVLEIPSDMTWRIVPEDQKGWRTRTSPQPNWPPARLIARFHDLPGLPDHPRVLFPSALQPTVIRFWQQGWFQITMLIISAIVGVFYLRLLARLALQSKAQQVLQRERARIARDIHDDLGAGLTQLVLLGETEQRELATEPEARAKFERISEAGRRLLGSIDEVVWLVNSQRDSLQDFEAYICRYAENFLRSSSVRCRLDVDAEIPQASFNLATRRNLFLAIKEALNNAVRHSGATEVALTIQATNEEVRVTVQDNGKGFDSAVEKPERNGMSNMVQRMAELDGDCRVTSQPGAGCCVELVVPLAEGRRRRRFWWK